VGPLAGGTSRRCCARSPRPSGERVRAGVGGSVGRDRLARGLVVPSPTPDVVLVVVVNPSGRRSRPLAVFDFFSSCPAKLVPLLLTSSRRGATHAGVIRTAYSTGIGWWSRGLQPHHHGENCCRCDRHGSRQAYRVVAHRRNRARHGLFPGRRSLVCPARSYTRLTVYDEFGAKRVEAHCGDRLAGLGGEDVGEPARVRGVPVGVTAPSGSY